MRPPTAPRPGSRERRGRAGRPAREGGAGYRTGVQSEPSTSRLWAVTSGWQGPFQHEEVLVAAAGPGEALRRAEQAFAGVAQPVCRAKMVIADLGALSGGLVVGPRRAGAALAADGDPVNLRCGDPLQPDYR